jgi:hypothetical protein
MFFLSRKKNTFVFLNIILPLFFGVLLYNTSILNNTKFINYIPDGLWSYSFTVTILWCWEWEICVFNIILIFFTELIFEILQKFQFVSGTFDYCDILVYIVFSIVAIIGIRFYKKTNQK